MSTHRHIDAICLVILLLMLLITLLFMNGKALGLRTIAEVEAEENEASLYFTANELNGDWSTDGAARISLLGSRAAVMGGGAYVYDGNVIIKSAGRYVVSGTLDNGSIVVDADSTSKVWIRLNSAELNCSDDACIRIEQAEKVFLTTEQGTENSLTTSGFSETAQADNVDGALFSRDDLTLNGAGSLTVRTVGANGIVSNDDLMITGGTIRVVADGDALHANDALRITDAKLELEAGDDGINLTGEESGLILCSGSITVKSGDKGLAAGDSVLILGGDLEIEAGTDGINATGTVRTEGGNLTITAGDDGIRADTAVEIAGGTIRIPSCYEGIEARTIDVSGGDISILPEDDGMNANGNSGGFGGGPGGFGGQPGGFGGERPRTAEGERPEGERPEIPGGERPQVPDENRPSMPEGEPPVMPADAFDGVQQPESSTTEEQETWIHVSGGSITIVNETARDADGLDSNGDIIITGGSIRISMINSGSNNALDYGSESGGRMIISGGDVIACGSYSMAEGFDTESGQCAMLYNFKRGAAGGTEIRLKDEDGNILLQYTVPCSFSSIAMSCPEMKQGESYTLEIGDTEDTITLTEMSAAFGDVESRGFGGNMNWGGMQFRPEDRE